MATANTNALNTPQATDAPFTRLAKFASFLSEWAREKYGEREDFERDIEPIWTLVETLGLHDRQKLLGILQHMPKDIHAPHTKSYYYPLPPTLNTYLIYEIIESPHAIRKMDQLWTTRSEGDRITVVRDSFLWLNTLVQYPSAWVGLLAPNTDDLESKRRFLDSRDWLASQRAEKFADGQPDVQSLTENEQTKLDQLWKTFQRNDQVPVWIAFALASLEIPVSRSDPWPKYREMISLMPRVE